MVGAEEACVEPEVWFHGLLRADGWLYDEAEIVAFRDATNHWSTIHFTAMSNAPDSN
jgi:hypothetical protein